MKKRKFYISAIVTDQSNFGTSASVLSSFSLGDLYGKIGEKAIHYANANRWSHTLPEAHEAMKAFQSGNWHGFDEDQLRLALTETVSVIGGNYQVSIHYDDVFDITSEFFVRVIYQLKGDMLQKVLFSPAETEVNQLSKDWFRDVYIDYALMNWGRKPTMDEEAMIKSRMDLRCYNETISIPAEE